MYGTRRVGMEASSSHLDGVGSATILGRGRAYKVYIKMFGMVTNPSLRLKVGYTFMYI